MIREEKIVEDFSRLGKIFGQVAISSDENSGLESDQVNLLLDAARQSYLRNPWFIPDFVKFAFYAWSNALQEDKISTWISRYSQQMITGNKPKTVAIIMAGNIPMVGLHDLLCVLASGNRALIKLSSSDEVLIPAVLKVLGMINPAYELLFQLTTGPLNNFDAIIATGSNNSSRYFDYYFGKYPHIIRKNRNGTAVLTGKETEEEMIKLADDIFLYFGLGCRNISKIYIPEKYDLSKIFNASGRYQFFSNHHKYRNNYDYQKSIMLINSIHHEDNGFLLIKQDQALISPISVLHAENYRSVQQLSGHLTEIQDNLQCIVSVSESINSAILPGKSQMPELWDYADGIDTLNFLLNL